MALILKVVLAIVVTHAGALPVPSLTEPGNFILAPSKGSD